MTLEMDDQIPNAPDFIYIYADLKGGLALSTSGFTTEGDADKMTLNPVLLRQLAAKLTEIADQIMLDKLDG